MKESELKTLIYSDYIRNIRKGSSWTSKCVDRLFNADNLTSIAAGVVGKHGEKAVEKFTGAWGIDIETCYAYCSRQEFPMVFPFPLLSTI